MMKRGGSMLQRRVRALYCCAFYFASIFLVVSTSAEIPFDGDGHVVLRRGSPAAALKVEVYLDLACSDSAAAWPVLTQVANAHGEEIEFLYRLFPLPYHRNAFTAAQAAQVMKLYSSGDDGVVASFFTAVFNGQGEILNDATSELKQAQVEDIFAKWATATGVVSLDDFRRGMADDDLNMKARFEFKYGCLHTVYGAPAVYVGGVHARGLDGGSSFDDWQEVLDPLVKASAPRVESDVFGR